MHPDRWVALVLDREIDIVPFAFAEAYEVKHEDRAVCGGVEVKHEDREASRGATRRGAGTMQRIVIRRPHLACYKRP